MIEYCRVTKWNKLQLKANNVEESQHITLSEKALDQTVYGMLFHSYRVLEQAHKVKKKSEQCLSLRVGMVGQKGPGRNFLGNRNVPYVYLGSGYRNGYIYQNS